MTATLSKIKNLPEHVAALRLLPQLPPKVCLDADGISAGYLRAYTADYLVERDLGSLLDAAVLFMSEVFTNFVVHGEVVEGMQRVLWSYFTRIPGLVVMGVEGTSAGVPLLHEAGPDDEGGRGWFLANEIMDDCGYMRLPPNRGANSLLVWGALRTSRFPQRTRCAPDATATWPKVDPELVKRLLLGLRAYDAVAA